MNSATLHRRLHSEQAPAWRMAALLLLVGLYLSLGCGHCQAAAMAQHGQMPAGPCSHHGDGAAPATCDQAGYQSHACAAQCGNADTAAALTPQAPRGPDLKTLFHGAAPPALADAGLISLAQQLRHTVPLPADPPAAVLPPFRRYTVLLN